jgi:PmbA protein
VAVLEKDIMLRIAEKAVQVALKIGAIEAEAFVYEGHATSVGIELGQISKTNQIIDRGLGIRVVANKSIGFAYTNIVNDEKAVENIVTEALSAAKASKPDPDWNGLPQKKNYSTTTGTFDQKIVELNPEELVKVASSMLDFAKEADKRVFPIEGGVGKGYVSNAVANSNGISAYDRGTMVDCSIAALAKDGNSVTPVCFEFNASRSCSLDPEWVGKEAAKLALSALKPKSVETQTTNVILTQFALQDLLNHTLIGAIKADSVQRGQSPLKDKIGEQVASEDLTICDDGLYASGLRTGLFDAEGVPHQTTTVIEKGILQNFLYDDYSAKKDSIESTGNASRAGYLSTPTIDTTNFHIMPQKGTPEQMLKEMGDGLMVYYLQGAHSSNPVSGEFSVVATLAWKIKDGKMMHPCKGVMLAGNIFELLKNISAVGANERQMGSIIAPWIQAENVRVIGK